MKLVKCDRHPDRDAVKTFRITEFPAGTRPLFMGYTTGAMNYIDLCEECANQVRVIKDDNER